jgi:hypothetical protein
VIFAGKQSAELLQRDEGGLVVVDGDGVLELVVADLLQLVTVRSVNGSWPYLALSGGSDLDISCSHMFLFETAFAGFGRLGYSHFVSLVEFDAVSGVMGGGGQLMSIKKAGRRELVAVSCHMAWSWSIDKIVIVCTGI